MFRTNLSSTILQGKKCMIFHRYIQEFSSNIFSFKYKIILWLLKCNVSEVGVEVGRHHKLEEDGQIHPIAIHSSL